MKIIFLDVDGVLNSEEWYKERAGKYKMDDVASQYPFYEFSPDHVANLNLITDSTDAKIVVSSTWRLGRPLDELKTLFKSVGVTGEIIDKTVHMGAPRNLQVEDSAKLGYTIPRGCEIAYWLDNKFQRINWSREKQQEYLDKNLVKNYVILDDDSDMLLNQREYFVKTGWRDGLTKEKAELAIRILNTSILDLYYATDNKSYEGLG